MADALVIVESPAKAKTINKFLGSSYKVEASMGHVRDLPKKELAVDESNDFAPSYVVSEDRKKVIEKLSHAAGKAKRILIATDPDREGEAIGWHLAQVLRERGHDLPVLRVMFNEITRRAVTAAIERPTEIDQRRVDAQQARRILDRLMGYKLSPLLWDRVRRGLSAGRVQSVALRIVCEREAAIVAFLPVEYWVLTAELEGKIPPSFKAVLKRRGGKELEVGAQAESDAVLQALDGATWRVASLETKERRRNPAAPFVTSKFQQEASRRFRMPVRKVMQVAQGLYEGRDLGPRGTVGLITYMRTDSTRVSDEAVAAAREHVKATLGAEYLPDRPPTYKGRAGAQDAHEAIRPTSLDLPPDAVRQYLSNDEYRIYALVWQRFVASQMKPALFDETVVVVEAAGFEFEARGSVLRFPGFLRVYQEASEDDGEGQDPAAREGAFPQLAVGDLLRLRELVAEQKFTQPPPRFTEATLVKELEENGIGRPSTYAQILQTLGQREYAILKEGRFHPTELGMLVNELVVGSFADLVDLGYTGTLEVQLDEIEEGRQDWVDMLRSFNRKLDADLARARKGGMPDIKPGVATGESCEKCGKPMLKRIGRYGFFVACSGYPECRNTRQEEEEGTESLNEPCPNCGKRMPLRRGRFGAYLACPDYPTCRGTARVREGADGSFTVLRDRRLDEACPECSRVLVEREGRYGKFVSCSGYPECSYVKQEKTGAACPEEGCGGDVVVRQSRRAKPFYGCSRYPKCDFVVWDRPVEGSCPKCLAPFITEKTTKRHGTFRCCWREGCGWHDGPDGAFKPARARAPRPAAAGRRHPPRRTAAAPVGKKAAAARAGAKAPAAPAARRRAAAKVKAAPQATAAAARARTTGPGA